MAVKRFYNVRLETDDIIPAFLTLIREYRVTAVNVDRKLLYIVEGETLCEGFRKKVRELVGFTNLREFPSPPDNVSTTHAKDAAEFFALPRPRNTRKK